MAKVLIKIRRDWGNIKPYERRQESKKRYVREHTNYIQDYYEGRMSDGEEYCEGDQAES